MLILPRLLPTVIFRESQNISVLFFRYQMLLGIVLYLVVLDLVVQKVFEVLWGIIFTVLFAIPWVYAILAVISLSH